MAQRHNLPDPRRLRHSRPGSGPHVCQLPGREGQGPVLLPGPSRESLALCVSVCVCTRTSVQSFSGEKMSAHTGARRPHVRLDSSKSQTTPLSPLLPTVQHHGLGGLSLQVTTLQPVASALPNQLSYLQNGRERPPLGLWRGPCTHLGLHHTEAGRESENVTNLEPHPGHRAALPPGAPGADPHPDTPGQLPISRGSLQPC